MNNKTIVNIDVQRYDRIREQGAFYIDENGSDVTLIIRPRRFRKTLNISMTECFFSNKYANRENLFEELEIWNDKRYRLIQGIYPVIFLSFAGVKAAGDADLSSHLFLQVSHTIAIPLSYQALFALKCETVFSHFLRNKAF